MNKLLLSAAALAAIAGASAASAQYQQPNYQQPYYNNGSAGNLTARIQQLQARMQAGIQSGEISRQEAQMLRPRLRELSRLDRQYAYNGYSGQERSDLQRRLRELRRDIRLADGGRGQYADDRWDGEDRYGQTGQYGTYEPIDRDRDGYDDRDYDRDGRWEDDVSGTYPEQRRGGVAGVIDTIFGTGGLRVGQRAPSNLGGVPYAYQSRFRDGGGVYYRSDGRQIYQIDARDGTVLRVYAIDR